MLLHTKYYSSSSRYIRSTTQFYFPFFFLFADSQSELVNKIWQIRGSDRFFEGIISVRDGMRKIVNYCNCFHFNIKQYGTAPEEEKSGF